MSEENCSKYSAVILNGNKMENFSSAVQIYMKSYFTTVHIRVGGSSGGICYSLYINPADDMQQTTFINIFSLFFRENKT